MGPPVLGLFAVRMPGVGGPLGGALPCGRPPARGPPAPPTGRGFSGMRPGRRPRGGAPPFLRAPRRLAGVAAGGFGGLAGVAPLGCRARGPPGAPPSRPLAVIVGGPCCPPATPSVAWLSFRPPGAAGPPPRGPGLVVVAALVPARPPRPAAVGALAPPPGGPSLLAPAPTPRILEDLNRPTTPRILAVAAAAEDASSSADPPSHRGRSRSRSRGSTLFGPSEYRRTSA